MAKVTAQEVKDMGFSPEMFGKTATTIDAFLDGVITEQAALLQGRIGTTLYSSATAPTSDYVKRTEKVLVAADLYDLRILRLAGTAVANGEQVDTRTLERQHQKFIDEADDLITRIITGGTADSSGYAGAVVETEHAGALEVPDA